MKIKVSRIPIYITLYILIIYALSRGSWGHAISYGIWIPLMQFCGVLCVALFLAKRRGELRKFELESLLLLVVILLFNNYNMKSTGMQYEFLLITLIVFAIVIVDTEFWMKKAISIMMVLGIFYAVATLVSVYSQEIYNTVFFPLLSSWNLKLYLEISDYYASGFTSHYTTNAMYIALALCAVCGFLVPYKPNSRNRLKVLKITIIVIVFVALLFTNKRAHILFTICGIFVVYYLYNSNQKMSRLFKILGMVCIGVLAMYLLSIFMPNSLVFINRMMESSESGDISNGRYAYWAIATSMFWNHPLLGNGWGAFHAIHNTHVHNVYLQLLAETGVVGFLIFVTYMVKAYYHSITAFIKSRKGQVVFDDGSERYLAISIMYQTFFLLYCLTGTCIYEAQTIVPYILFTTMGTHYWRKMKYMLYEQEKVQNENRNNDLVLRG